MADVTKITLPNGTTKDIKDATARKQANWNTNNGVKNFADMSKSNYTTATLHNVTVTYLGNNEFLIDGTADSDTNNFYNIYFPGSSTYLSTIMVPSGDYIMSVEGGSNVTLTYLENGSAKVNYPADFTKQSIKVSIPNGITNNWVRLVLKANTTYSNVRVKFMIRPAFIEDDTFEPYALPNTKITPELIELVDSGAKNLLSVNSDSASSDGFMFSDVPITLKGGTEYIFSYTNSASVRLNLVGYANASSSTKLINLVISSTDNVAGSHYYSIIPSADVGVVSLYANNVSTTTNLTNIMICTKAAWDVSQKFVPYRPTYEETVEQVAENENNISSLSTLTQGIDGSGNDFIEINGIKLFVSSTAPTSGMAEGDVGIGW